MKNLWMALFSLALFTAQVPAAEPAQPDAVIQKATGELQELLNRNHEKYSSNIDLFYRVVDNVVVPHFDTRYIAQLVLGRNWKSANDDQRKHFEAAFKNMLIRSYANALLEYYDSVKVEWKPLRLPSDATDVTVNSTLLRPGKQPVPVGFAMHLAGNEWKIYDIVVENISLVSNFRSQVNSEIKRTSLDDVITRMESGAYNNRKSGPATKS